jgi:hypothetical protein
LLGTWRLCPLMSLSFSADDWKGGMRFSCWFGVFVVGVRFGFRGAV